MPTTIDSAGITFNDATSLTSATLAANSVGATQITNGSVTASKLGTNEQKQICKAWVNFNGTTSPGTIRSSYNVSSVTKNGTGDYTVNFTSAMTDANYSVSSSIGGTVYTTMVGQTGRNTIPPSFTTSSFKFTIVFNNAGTFTSSDAPDVHLTVFGN